MKTTIRPMHSLPCSLHTDNGGPAAAAQHGLARVCCLARTAILEYGQRTKKVKVTFRTENRRKSQDPNVLALPQSAAIHIHGAAASSCQALVRRHH
eukprot:518768-Prymnesium_polylepis.1